MPHHARYPFCLAIVSVVAVAAAVKFVVEVAALCATFVFASDSIAGVVAVAIRSGRESSAATKGIKAKGECLVVIVICVSPLLDKNEFDVVVTHLASTPQVYLHICCIK